VIGRSPQPELRPLRNLAAAAPLSLQARTPPQIPNRVQAAAQPRCRGRARPRRGFTWPVHARSRPSSQARSRASTGPAEMLIGV